MRRTLIAALVLCLSMIGQAPGVSLAGGGGPIPGCEPATHEAFLGPWDGGKWFYPSWNSNRKPLVLAIAHTWANLNDPDIKDHPRNPGQPAWNQTFIKTKITPRVLANLGGRKVRLYGLGGEVWIYKNTKACRRNIGREFQNGDMPVHTLGELADEGLAYIY